jgi:hypothetical protein
MPSRRAHISLAVSALLAVAALASAQVALALFTKSAGGGPLTVVTSTLSAPTSPTASQVSCRSSKTPEIEVAWSATSSSYATSYTVERATAGSGPYTSLGSVAIGETTYIDKSGSLAYSTTYYYRVSAVYHSWSATSSSASVRTLSKSCQSS